MFANLRDLHNFVARQALYPLLLSTLLAGAFFAYRVIDSHTFNYSNLVWILFLAWIPYACSMAAAALHQIRPRVWWILFIPGTLWLIFFPNAPYMVTGFYHLEYRWPMPLWYDIGLIAIFAFTGCFLAIASLRTMQSLVKSYLGRFAGWVFALVAIGFGGLGVYLGRLGRYNSWDLFIHPKLVLEDIAKQMLTPRDNLEFVGFTLMFTSILLVFYLMFVTTNRPDEPG
jgi:uncharacterized membrane protein